MFPSERVSSMSCVIFRNHSRVCSCARQTTRRRPSASQCTVPEPVSRKEAAPSSCVRPRTGAARQQQRPRPPGVPVRRGIQRLAAVVRPSMDACPVGQQHFDRGHGVARRRPVQGRVALGVGGLRSAPWLSNADNTPAASLSAAACNGVEPSSAHAERFAPRPSNTCTTRSAFFNAAT